MKARLAAAAAIALILVGSRPALAHGFGPTYDIPIPLWLYLYGAAAAVVLAFAPLALFSRKSRTADAAYQYPRFDLFRVRWLRRLLTSRLLLGGLRLLSVTLFFIVVIAGLVGLQSGFNFAPTFVWVTWWVGFGFLTALVGNLWPLVNPWRVLFDSAEWLARRLGFRDGSSSASTYPEPSHLASRGDSTSCSCGSRNAFRFVRARNIALFVVAYTLVTSTPWHLRQETGCATERHLRVFGLLGKFAHRG